ncbi:hypothetical protein B0T22DRAFT_436807 [Podospora appendiculata]|uniref:Zn(2)-C6 fungal-type domain-containing protein n=1 Tax=Podospora appendiculata TaxID=314037 RepID=A0AAE1CGF8_9PEZI|nr:hypothetical protein B0T22DRAFT_436807 [Podospora appendiculata]
MDKTENQLHRPRVINACEACRAAKVKCQASNQLGICKRCLDSKRECIFKTGPRTRRPRQSRLTANAVPRPPPAGPSKTFTIDIPMPAGGDDEDAAASLETLRLRHRDHLEKLLPEMSDEGEDDYDYDYGYDYNPFDFADPTPVPGTADTGSVASHASSLPLGASALSTSPSSIIASTSTSTSTSTSSKEETAAASSARSAAATAAFSLQPQFNLDSATSLLATFRSRMLAHFPCVVLPPDSTVVSLARQRPFVLLAVLAAASSSRTLQGHSLYDGEFRKMLALKFVAGGERSLELLQGLIIYVSWYPAHLRPKSRQAFQYIRIAVDMTSDLELDQDSGTEQLAGEEGSCVPTPERLDEIRTYLASYYRVSNDNDSFLCSWNHNAPPLPYTEYTSKCCDVLEQHSPLEGDGVLVTFSLFACLLTLATPSTHVRLQRIAEEANAMRKTHKGHLQSKYQISLMLRGLEMQLHDCEARMSAAIAATPSVRISLLFTRIFLLGTPLLRFSSATTQTAAAADAAADPRRLAALIPTLHAMFDYVLAMPPASLNAMTGGNWGCFIIAIIVGFRMSFPLAVCPGWDDRAARRDIRLGAYLDRMCCLGDGDGECGGGDDGARKSAVDVLTAGKVVLGEVRKKYRTRVAKLELPPPPLDRPSQPASLLSGLLGMHTSHGAGLAAPSSSGPVPGFKVDKSMSGCPMLDGSLEAYYPYWDESFTNSQGSAGPQTTTGTAAVGGLEELATAPDPGAYNDVWAAMTMGWAQHPDINFDGF